MAVTVGTELVNNGNSGWTQAHVMDALEKVFYELGWNSGTQKNGVPIACLPPGADISTSSGDFGKCIDDHWAATPEAEGDDDWAHTGGAAITVGPVKSRYFYVTNTGTTSYNIAEEVRPTSVNSTTNVITTMYMGVNLTTGTKITYNGQGTDVITGLSTGNVYYMRRVSDNEITLHNSANDANNNSGTVGVTYPSSFSDPKRFRTDAVANGSITASRGDKLYFYTHATTDGGNFRVADFSQGAAYDATRHYHSDDNVDGDGASKVTGSGTYESPFEWDTRYFMQTESEVFDPTQITGVGYQGIYAYGYCNDVNANLKGTITLTNDIVSSNSYSNKHYYKYTVPASGSRSELKLRIYRNTYGTNAGRPSAIMICSEATGWSDNEVFTIPGTAIGGASPANDIVFGANTDETSSGAGDGKPSILTTNLGSGANMFQKHPDGYYGVLRLENDASKKFGVTYWGFALHTDNYRITLKSGSDWSYLNRLGKHYIYNSSTQGYFGAMRGDMGLDYQSGNNYLNRVHSYETYHNYATTNTPTNYALKIRYFKANAPQDTNFAVIQFIQTINSIDYAYFTFSLPKGSSYGGNVWDYDQVWSGTYCHYSTYWEAQGFGSNKGKYIEMRYITPGYDYGNSGPHAEPASGSALTREANYGYMRTTVGDFVGSTIYNSNIDTHNQPSNNEVYTYFRSANYDKVTNSTLYREQNVANRTKSVGVDYYKPIKGLPINNQLVPCPYYLPDDFVMIQAEVSPGATNFLPGDTVTISGSEVYTIITADNQNNLTGLDGVANNTANGMIFAARTT